MALSIHPIEPLTAAASGVIIALVLGMGNPKPRVDHTAIQSTAAPVSASGPTMAQKDHTRIRTGIPVEVLRVIDGDTVEVRAQIWLDQHVTTKVRIRAIDAPERQSRCAEEKRLAEASRDQLVGLLGRGPTYLTDLGRDKYGSRVLGRLLTATGIDVGDQMVRDGHARSYTGGKRSGWC